MRAGTCKVLEYISIKTHKINMRVAHTGFRVSSLGFLGLGF